MHNNYYTAAFFVWSGLMFAVGMGVGQLLCVKRRHGKSLIGIEPVISERWEALKTVAWVMAMVMFASVIYYSLAFTTTQRECNNDLYQRLDYRAQIATSDRALSDQRDTAVVTMVKELLALQPGSSDSARKILEEYQAGIDEINRKFAENEKQRQDNQLPDCAGKVDNG